MSYQVITTDNATPAITLTPLSKTEFKAWESKAPARLRRWVKAAGFEAKPGQSLAIPDEEGNISGYLFGMQERGWLFQLATLYRDLPEGVYVLSADWTPEQVCQATLGWGLASYHFDRYKKNGRPVRTLQISPETAARVQPLCDAHYLVRDLVNTPTEHMGPQQLADAVAAEADRFGAKCRITIGEDLLTNNFPAVHAVGRASVNAPRVVEMTWGDADAPLIALLGKGVCFDTGGLDLKNAQGMALMKKDMGGAAHALALASLIMLHELPVRLMLVIPAVENSVAGNAYRPGDVITTRKGLSVEIGNTDAEGRVVLSDALAYACEHQPDFVVDFATLTGAARVALGPDLPALFSNTPGVAESIMKAGESCEDPLWIMPLWQPYVEQIRSPIADLNNSSKSSYAGCITAALFLEHFVTPEIPWVHIDTFAWNQSSRPGRPEGGEAIGLRAVFDYIVSRYA